MVPNNNEIKITAIKDIIPEKNIIIFSPHYDDVLFMLGGYILGMKDAGLLKTKDFTVQLIFSRSNYQAGEGAKNFDEGNERIKYATGNRLIEDMDCNDELFGDFGYTYQLLGERECFTRGKAMAESEMEFPHGMYDDFNQKDTAIFERLKQRIAAQAMLPDTALVFPMAIKEHIDHFIVREAAITMARELGISANAKFYFQEDKPYGGIASEEELARMETFIASNQLKSKWYSHNPEEIIDLAFKHFISQVEEVYKTGVRNRAAFWKAKAGHSQGVDRICLFRS